MSVLTDIVKLCTELIDRIKTRKDNYFVTFIDPIQNNFQKLHTDYINSFNKYINMLENEDIEIGKDSSIFKELRKDSKESSIVRSDIEAALNTASENDNQLIIEYVESIWSYLSVNNLDQPVGVKAKPLKRGDPFLPVAGNVPRIRAMNRLDAILDQKTTGDIYRKVAVQCLEYIVSELQECYQQQKICYELVKREFRKQ